MNLFRIFEYITMCMRDFFSHVPPNMYYLFVRRIFVSGHEIRYNECMSNAEKLDISNGKITQVLFINLRILFLSIFVSRFSMKESKGFVCFMEIFHNSITNYFEIIRN